MKKRLSLKLKYAYLLVLLVPLLYPAAAAAGALSGLRLCAGVLIPTLLPFLILSELAVSSGAFAPAERLLRFPVRLLFNLPPAAATPLTVGLICGYPVGARTAALLYESGALSRRDTQRVLCFCICASPQFMLSTVGAALLGSARAGLYIYLASLLSCLAVGIVTGAASRFSRKDPVSLDVAGIVPTKSGGLIQAVTGGTESMLRICALMVLFSSLWETMCASGLVKKLCFMLSSCNPRLGDGFWFSVLNGVFEVTGGCVSAAGVLSGSIAMLVCAGLTGFGGICVLFQAVTLLKTKRRPRIGILPMTVSRAAHAALTTAFAAMFLTIDKSAVPAFSAGGGAVMLPAVMNIPAALVMLALTAAVLLGCCQKQMKNNA